MIGIFTSDNRRGGSHPETRPTPAPRVSLPGAMPSLLSKRGASPHSSGHPSPAGTGSRGDTGERVAKSNQSPLIRSREVTPNHSRQSSGQQAPPPFRSPPQPFPHPARIQSYPDSSSESEGMWPNTFSFYIFVGVRKIDLMCYFM